MGIDFSSISDTKPVVEYLAETLNQKLATGKKIAWLVPGGSSIAIAAEVSQKLNREHLANLAVTLTDERYGELDHPDSNWRQLKEAGFDLPGAMLLPVLTGDNMENTVTRFANMLQQLLKNADYSIGFFGIGADGHTAGMLPGSPAVTEKRLAAGYDAGQFKRITMTPPAIAGLSEAVVYAVGEAKWPVLKQLKTTDLPIKKQPAQSLKQVSKLTVFSNLK